MKWIGDVNELSGKICDFRNLTQHSIDRSDEEKNEANHQIKYETEEELAVGVNCTRSYITFSKSMGNGYSRACREAVVD